MSGELMTESTSEQHRGAEVPAERSPHLHCGEGETWLWICENGAMNCSKPFICNNSNMRYARGADL